MKRKARQRLEEAADRMACELLKMAIDANVADSVKLAAIRDALDRAGLAAKSAVEVEVGPPKPYEHILNGITVLEGGSREAFRRSRGAFDDIEAKHRIRGSDTQLAAPVAAQAVSERLDADSIATQRRPVLRRQGEVLDGDS
ncbi:hypothetical protein [Mycobacterium sp.]|uniref:hypothetical protein n=1 Tax=Mycobacterium sp. TaxID=1785 RepID=UPI00257F3C61|nr:hypothetical protein [Mycobacterium sp.]